MPDNKPTCGKVSFKLYRCTNCGHESKHSTNHWGDIYPPCTNCSWKQPLETIALHECLEPCPPEYDLPPKWKLVKLGAVAQIIVNPEEGDSNASQDH